jgi:hypothetical protein
MTTNQPSYRHVRLGHQPAMAELLLVLALCVAGLIALWALRIQPPDTSSDGRRHSCGVVTEEGVTEHLAEYLERCG